MGSFRSKASIASAIGTLVPKAELEDYKSRQDPNFPAPVGSNVLQVGEWVKYRRVLPLAAQNAIADAAAQPKLGPKGEFLGMTVGAGTTSLVKLQEGVTGMRLLDENGNAVAFDSSDPYESIAGMDEWLRRELMAIIGDDDEEDLGTPEDPADPNSATVGEDSAGI